MMHFSEDILNREIYFQAFIWFQMDIERIIAYMSSSIHVLCEEWIPEHYLNVVSCLTLTTDVFFT